MPKIFDTFLLLLMKTIIFRFKHCVLLNVDGCLVGGFCLENFVILRSRLRLIEKSLENSYKRSFANFLGFLPGKIILKINLISTYR